MGEAQEARAVIAELEATSRERFVPPYTIAIVHAGLAEHDAAFEWLERAYAARDVHMVFLTVDPRWDALRDDPRFADLLARCRFFGGDPGRPLADIPALHSRPQGPPPGSREPTRI